MLIGTLLTGMLSMMTSSGVPFIVLAFIAGLLIGSFLNVCIFRLPRDISVADPVRSFCPECDTTIAWYDNIPLLSYLLLRGRCRHCEAHIPIRYPLVELATAVLFAVAAARFGWSVAALKYAIFCAILIALIATDAEERILPDEFTLGGVLIGMALAYFVQVEVVATFFLMPRTWSIRWHWVGESALGALLAGGVIWLIGYLYEKIRHREGLGLGDVKMIAMIGAFLGLRAALGSLMLASLAGALLGFIYIKVAKKDASTYELPFGSFIGVAAWVLATFGLP